jgi:hypothetical protein
VGGFAGREARVYFEEIRDDNAPRRQSWRENVISNGLACYDETLKGLAVWAREGLKAAD